MSDSAASRVRSLHPDPEAGYTARGGGLLPSNRPPWSGAKDCRELTPHCLCGVREGQRGRERRRGVGARILTSLSQSQCPAVIGAGSSWSGRSFWRSTGTRPGARPFQGTFGCGIHIGACVPSSHLPLAHPGDFRVPGVAQEGVPLGHLGSRGVFRRGSALSFACRCHATLDAEQLNE